MNIFDAANHRDSDDEPTGRAAWCDDRRRDVARGYCRGCATPGEAVWCQLCRWSPSYFRPEEVLT